MWQYRENLYFSLYIGVPLADQIFQISGQTVELSKQLRDLSAISFLDGKAIRLRAVLSQEHAGKYQKRVIQSLASEVDISAHYQGKVGIMWGMIPAFSFVLIITCCGRLCLQHDRD